MNTSTSGWPKTAAPSTASAWALRVLRRLMISKKMPTSNSASNSIRATAQIQA